MSDLLDKIKELPIAAQAAGAAVGLVATGFALTWYFSPGTLVKIRYNRAAKKAGLTKKCIKSGEFTWEYFDGGDPDLEPLVMVHGYSASKEAYLEFASYFTHRFRVLIPDLPGHGNTVPQDCETSYDYKSQTIRLHEFLGEVLSKDDQKSDGTVYMIGHSMGGAIAGMYAAEYPDQVKTLGLVCPGGFDTPEKSELTKDLEAGKPNPLLADTFENFNRMLNKVYFTPPVIPQRFLLYAFNERKTKLKLYDKILKDLRNPDQPRLEDCLSQISASTCVIWGDKDYLIHASGANGLKEKMTNASEVDVTVIKNCGHSLILEQGGTAARHYGDFLYCIPD